MHPAYEYENKLIKTFYQVYETVKDPLLNISFIITGLGPTSTMIFETIRTKGWISRLVLHLVHSKGMDIQILSPDRAIIIVLHMPSQFIRVSIIHV